MSAIAGVFRRDGRAEGPERLFEMMYSMKHRGPRARIWCEPAVGLAQGTHGSRSSEHDAHCHELSSRLGGAIVADARIDNRRDIGAALRIDRVERLSDPELILLAYQQWGTDCVSRLIGDFAFALWDPREHRIFCARDPMGVKPLYYFRSARLFAFASEIKALLTLAEVPRHLSAEQVALYVAGAEPDRESTMYAEVRRLPAASWMAVMPDRIRDASYWRPDPRREIRFSTDEEYVEDFREIFVEAVRARLPQDGCTGATLSGGLDSSSITCVARRLLRERGATAVHAFSLVFPELPPAELHRIDERSYIDRVVSGGNIVHHAIRGDAVSPLGCLDAALDALDQPSGAPNLYLHWALYGAARNAGVDVILDGFDGDTAVSHGFGRLDELLRHGDLDTFEREVRAFATRRSVAEDTVLSHHGLPTLRTFAQRGEWAHWIRLASELARRFRLSRRELVWTHGLAPRGTALFRTAPRSGHAIGESLVSPTLASVVATARSTATPEAAAGPSLEREAHALGIALPLYQRTLEVADHAAWSFGIEPRFPFFDRRLLEFCLAVPADQKFRDGWPRFLFRRAMEDILPPDLQWRGTKADLSPNFRRGLVVADRARIEGLRNPDPLLAPYVHSPALSELTDLFLAPGSRDVRQHDGILLARVAELSRWLVRRSRTPPTPAQRFASADAKPFAPHDRAVAFTFHMEDCA